MGPIQVIPPGLMGLLQLKQEGRLPGNLSETVAPVIELRDWYLTARRVSEASLFPNVGTIALATGNIGGFGFPNALVPNNQIWWVEQMTVSVNNTGAMVATDLVRFGCSLISTTDLVHQLVSVDVADNALAARSRDIRAAAPRGFWALPGDQFALTVFDILTTNGYTARLGVRATPCPI